MKKIVVILSVSLLVLVTAVTVYAKGAEVIGVGLGGNSNGECSVKVVLSDGSFYEFNGTSKAVKANNAGENVVFQCRGKLTTDPPASAIRANSDRSDFSFLCIDDEFNFVSSNNWWIDITPSGNAVYKCLINPSH